VPVPGEEIRQVARAAREIASLPGLDDPAPVAPGLRTPGTGHKDSGMTRGGLAGMILAAHERSRGAQPEVDPAPPPRPEPEPEPEPERDAQPELAPDAAQEIADRIRHRLEPLPEPAAPAAPTYRTMPTAMSAPAQLEEAAELYGHDPLRAPSARSRWASPPT
jgi:hypothetical protein